MYVRQSSHSYNGSMCYHHTNTGSVDKFIGLFCRILSVLWGSFAEETYNCICYQHTYTCAVWDLMLRKECHTLRHYNAGSTECQTLSHNGVATISRLLRILGLFCRI